MRRSHCARVRLPEQKLLRWLLLSLLTGLALIVLVVMAIIIVGLIEGAFFDY